MVKILLIDKRRNFKAVKAYLVYSSKIDVAHALSCPFSENSSHGCIAKCRSYAMASNYRIFKSNGRCHSTTPEVLPLYSSFRKTIDSKMINRILYSIGQDICQAATNGSWKLLKHLLLSLTVCPLFHSKQSKTLLHRFEHSEINSFSLELETAYYCISTVIQFIVSPNHSESRSSSFPL